MAKNKTVRVEVEGLGDHYAYRYGVIAHVVPGESIRIIGYGDASARQPPSPPSAETRTWLKALPRVAGWRAVARDYLAERGELTQTFDRTFKIGDVIEYDSYNLHYTNPILQVTARAVIVQNHNRGRKHVKLSEFVWRNWNLDLDDIARRNHDTSMHI